MKKDEIIGKWKLKDGRMIRDENCKLIEKLIHNEFTKVQTSEDGWTVTYKSKDGTIWELTYPESHLHGGGPPKLTRKKE